MPIIKKVIRNCKCEVAKRQRRCARNKDHIIAGGEKCFVFKENMNTKSYCLQCAALMLEYAKKNIKQLCDDLELMN